MPTGASLAKSRVSITYLTSCALSLLGNSVAGVILPLILLATTGDALAAGSLSLICAVPQFVIGLVGGTIVDRLNRRNVSIFSDILSALSVALLPVVDMVWGLSFGWFVALGLLGAVGDIPGMTARNALLPEVCRYDHRDMQKFMGLAQSMNSLTVIVGPALAALLMASIGDSKALWFTSAMSLAAALVTITLPRKIGRIEQDETTDEKSEKTKESLSSHPLRTLGKSLASGTLVLFRSDALLRASMLLSFGIVMIMGSFQGLVLPVHFSGSESPELLGYVISAISAGMFASSLIYSALARRLSRRAWFVISLLGMAIGIIIIGLLPDFPLLICGAALMGLAAGPASALMGFFVMDRIPAESRGVAFGTQNSLMLVAAPVAVFFASAVVEVWGKQVGGIVLDVLWILVTVVALFSPTLRHLDDEKQ